MSGKQFEVSNSDLCSLESFPLKWRWTEEKYHKLSAEIISQIKPLSEQKANEIWEIQSRYLFSENFDEAATGNENFIKTELVNAEIVADWLKTRIGNERDFVYICWNEDWAVKTAAAIFCEYWDDFCYPASDDVAILTEKVDWIINYHHEEYLFFRKLI